MTLQLEKQKKIGFITCVGLLAAFAVAYSIIPTEFDVMICDEFLLNLIITVFFSSVILVLIIQQKRSLKIPIGSSNQHSSGSMKFTEPKFHDFYLSVSCLIPALFGFWVCWVYWRDGGLPETVALGGGFAILIVICLACGVSRALTEVATILILGATLTLAMTGYLQLFGNTGMTSELVFKYHGMQRISGLLDNPNTFALCLIPGLSITFAFLLSSLHLRALKRFAASGLAFLVYAVAILLSFSRGGWFASAVSLLTIFVLDKISYWTVLARRQANEPTTNDRGQYAKAQDQAVSWGPILLKKMKPGWVLAPLALILWYVMLAPFSVHISNPIIRRVFSLGNQHDLSWKNRVEGYLNGLAMIPDFFWTGFGFGYPETACQTYYSPLSHSEVASPKLNDFIFLNISMGGVFAAAFFAWMGFIFWSFVSRASQSDAHGVSNNDQDWKLGLFGACTGMLAGSSFNYLLTDKASSWTFFLTLAVVLSGSLRNVTSNLLIHGAMNMSRFRPFGYSTLLAILIAGLTLGVGLWVQAARCDNKIEVISASAYGTSARALCVIPKIGQKHPLIVFLQDGCVGYNNLGKVVREISGFGYAVLIVNYPIDDEFQPMSIASFLIEDAVKQALNKSYVDSTAGIGWVGRHNGSVLVADLLQKIRVSEKEKSPSSSSTDWLVGLDSFGMGTPSASSNVKHSLKSITWVLHSPDEQSTVEKFLQSNGLASENTQFLNANTQDGIFDNDAFVVGAVKHAVKNERTNLQKVKNWFSEDSAFQSLSLQMQNDLAEKLVLAPGRCAEWIKSLTRFSKEDFPRAVTVFLGLSIDELAMMSTLMFEENFKDAMKIRNRISWAREVPEDIYFKYAVNPRVYDEPPVSSRKELRAYRERDVWKFCSDAQTKYCKDQLQAINAIYLWYKPQFQVDRGDHPVRSGTSHTKELFEQPFGNCRHVVQYWIAAARAAGIPARPAQTVFTGKYTTHEWVEVWDVKEKAWHPADFAANHRTYSNEWIDRVVKPVIYVPRGDGKDWNALDEGRVSDLGNSLPLYLPTGTIHFRVTDETGPAKNVPVAVHVCSAGKWKIIYEARTDASGEAKIEVASTERFYPYLVSSTGPAEKSAAGFCNVMPDETCRVELQLTKHGWVEEAKLAMPKDFQTDYEFRSRGQKPPRLWKPGHQ